MVRTWPDYQDRTAFLCNLLLATPQRMDVITNKNARVLLVPAVIYFSLIPILPSFLSPKSALYSDDDDDDDDESSSS